MGSDDRGRYLETLERLLANPSADLRTAMTHAADEVARALRSDKVDIFMHDPSRNSLFAVGASNQPLSVLQRRAGLDHMPIANKGRCVLVFQEGVTFMSGHIERDQEELRGIREVLKVKSLIAVPLDIGGARRGVLAVTSLAEEFFDEEDVRLAEAVAKWLGIVAHRAELTEEIARNAAEQGRRTVAEELITVLAHDLRNHLSPITMRLGLLKRRADRDARAEDVRDLHASQRAIARLTELISDILDVARIDQGVFSMTFELIDLGALVHEVSSGLTTPDHPIIVKVSADAVVSGDPARLRQCLENLLSNAVNYSPKDGAVTVLVSRRAEAASEMALVEVIDEGPGISPDLLPHLFERFVTGKTKKGLGLGLYIAKEIASMHNGELTAVSTPGKGAQFTLKLPVSAN